MRTFRTIPAERRTDLPARFGDDVRFPAAFAETFIREYTDEGDAVLDPFAGFGTTLAAAEALDRVPYGIEYEADRVAYVRDRIDHGEHVIHGSVLDLDPGDLPAFDCCLTSPPYMARGDTRNPFENYSGESTYDDYLDDVRDAFAGLSECIPDATVLIEVSNLENEGTVTTLAWDVADAASDVLDFEGETVVCWDGMDGENGEGDGGDGTYGYGYDHSYCLVFR